MKLSKANEEYLRGHRVDDPKELVVATGLDIRTVRAALKRFAANESSAPAPAPAPAKPAAMRGHFSVDKGTVSLTQAQATADDNLPTKPPTYRLKGGGKIHKPFPDLPSQ